MTNWPISPLAMRYARGFAERNMTAKVRITRPAPASLQPNGELEAVAASVVYEGKARVYPATGPVTMNLGDENQYFQNSNVSVPLYDGGVPVLPQVDDIVEVLWHDDPLFLNRVFRVMDVEAAGQIPTVRRMQVMGVQRWRSWTPEEKLTRAPKTPPREIPTEWIV